MAALSNADAALRREMARGPALYPRVTAAYRFVLRHPWIVLALVALVRGILLYSRNGFFDGSRLVPAGDQLLSRDWANAFRDPFIQEGPAQLFLYGGVDKLS